MLFGIPVAEKLQAEISANERSSKITARMTLGGGTIALARSIPARKREQWGRQREPEAAPKTLFRRAIAELGMDACLGTAAIGAATMAPFGPRKSDAAMAPGVQVARQNQRRNQPSHSRPSRGDVRVADFAAHGYASTWRSDQGRQGFARNFW